jgi:hypothetical protein
MNHAPSRFELIMISKHKFHEIKRNYAMKKHKIPNSNRPPAKFRVKKGNHQQSYIG